MYTARRLRVGSCLTASFLLLIGFGSIFGKLPEASAQQRPMTFAEMQQELDRVQASQQNSAPVQGYVSNFNGARPTMNGNWQAGMNGSMQPNMMQPPNGSLPPNTMQGMNGMQSNMMQPPNASLPPNMMQGMNGGMQPNMMQSQNASFQPNLMQGMNGGMQPAMMQPQNASFQPNLMQGMNGGMQPNMMNSMMQGLNGQRPGGLLGLLRMANGQGQSFNASNPQAQQQAQSAIDAVRYELGVSRSMASQAVSYMDRARYAHYKDDKQSAAYEARYYANEARAAAERAQSRGAGIPGAQGMISSAWAEADRAKSASDYANDAANDW